MTKNYKIIIAVLILFNTAMPSNKNSLQSVDLSQCQNIWKKSSEFKSISPWTFTSKNRTATHEAGHIVVGKALNITIKKASIKEKSDRYGETHFSTNDESAKIKLLLGGYLSEVALLKKASYNCDNDLSNAIKKIITLHKIDIKDQKAIDKKINKYLKETSEIVSLNLEIISIFKEKLLEKKVLKETVINSIYSESTEK